MGPFHLLRSLIAAETGVTVHSHPSSKDHVHCMSLASVVGNGKLTFASKLWSLSSEKNFCALFIAVTLEVGSCSICE